MRLRREAMQRLSVSRAPTFTENTAVEGATSRKVTAAEELQSVYRMRLAGDVDGLVRALSSDTQDDVHTVRAAAARCLGSLRAERATESLADLLTDEVDDVRLASTNAIGKIGLQSGFGGPVQLLKSMLDDSDPAVRGSAMFWLGRMREPTAVAALTSALADPSRRVRRLAASALGEIGDVRAAHALNEARRAEPIWHRRWFSRALRELVMNTHRASNAVPPRGGEPQTTQNPSDPRE